MPRVRRPLVHALAVAAGISALAAVPAQAAPTRRAAPAAQTAVAPPVAHSASLATSAATFILRNLAAGVLQKVGGQAFGSALAEVGFGDPNEARLKEMDAKLTQITESINALQHQVDGLTTSLANSRLSAVRHSVSTLVGRIDHGTDLLRQLTSGSIRDPTLRAEKRQELLDLIKNHLLADQGVLDNAILNPHGNDDIVRMASFAEVNNGKRFFNDETSRHMFSIVGYYRDEAAQLLLLRIEYEYSSVKQDSTEQYKEDKRVIIKGMIDKLNALFGRINDTGPNRIPDPNEVVDTKTGLVWHTPRHGIYTLSAVNSLLAEQPWHKLPTLGEFRAIVADRKGKTPPEYLKSQGWTIPTHCVRDAQDYRQNSLPATTTVFWTSDRSGNNRWAWGGHDDGQGLLGHACIMTVDPTLPGVRYW